jgi:hypothetical protein
LREKEVPGEPWTDPRVGDTERYELEIAHLATQSGKKAEARQLVERIYAETEAEALQYGKAGNSGVDKVWREQRFGERLKQVLDRLRQGDTSDISTSASPVRTSGIVGSGDLTGAAYGAGLGGIAPADSAEERARNMAVGAGIGLAPGVINRVRGTGTVGDPILTAGAGGGRKPPKPDSPEAIKAAVRDIAKPPKAPTRLEQMVEAGKDASVPPINAMPTEAGAAGAKALRMLERGRTPLDIYDETSVALLPYNGANIPIMSSKMGPEELTRVFYSWLAEPPAKRPAWVQRIIDDAPKKKGMLLTERQQVAPPQTNALAQPLPPARFPGGAAALGAGAGILTGIPAGALGGPLMAREQDRKRNALAQ